MPALRCDGIGQLMNLPPCLFGFVRQQLRGIIDGCLVVRAFFNDSRSGSIGVFCPERFPAAASPVALRKNVLERPSLTSQVKISTVASETLVWFPAARPVKEEG